MDITVGVYPDFPTEASLEELTLSMARKILENQKDMSLNPNNNDYISLSLDEEEEVATVDFEGAECELIDGILVAKNYFSGATFAEGTGSYPYDRTELVDAFMHCALHQNAMEISRAANFNQDIKYVNVSIVQGEWGVGQSLRISINLTNIPIVVELHEGYSRTKSKPYLENPI
jgi:hypothetical protein